MALGNLSVGKMVPPTCTHLQHLPSGPFQDKMLTCHSCVSKNGECGPWLYRGCWHIPWPCAWIVVSIFVLSVGCRIREWQGDQASEKGWALACTCCLSKLHHRHCVIASRWMGLWSQLLLLASCQSCRKGSHFGRNGRIVFSPVPPKAFFLILQICTLKVAWASSTLGHATCCLSVSY